MNFLPENSERNSKFLKKKVVFLQFSLYKNRLFLSEDSSPERIVVRFVLNYTVHTWYRITMKINCRNRRPVALFTIFVCKTLLDDERS